MQADIIHLRYNKPDAGNITHGTSETTADTFYFDFIVLIDEVDSTVAYCKCRYLAPVLDKLNTNTFPDRGVWLFCFNTDLFKDYTSSLGRALKWIGF